MTDSPHYDVGHAFVPGKDVAVPNSGHLFHEYLDGRGRRCGSPTHCPTQCPTQSPTQSPTTVWVLSLSAHICALRRCGGRRRCAPAAAKGVAQHKRAQLRAYTVRPGRCKRGLLSPSPNFALSRGAGRA